MEFFWGVFETFLEGSVDLIIYRDYIVNRRFFLFTVVWPQCEKNSRAEKAEGTRPAKDSFATDLKKKEEKKKKKRRD